MITACLPLKRDDELFLDCRPMPPNNQIYLNTRPLSFAELLVSHLFPLELLHHISLPDCPTNRSKLHCKSNANPQLHVGKFFNLLILFCDPRGGLISDLWKVKLSNVGCNAGLKRFHYNLKYQIYINSVSLFLALPLSSYSTIGVYLPNKSMELHN